MTLEHRLLHRNRNKMKRWKCMVPRPNALKSSHFSHSKCYKNTFLKRITWNLYIHSSESILVHVFRFFENFEILGDFWKHNKKMLKKSQNFQNFHNFKNPRKQFCSPFFYEYGNLFRLSLSFKISVTAISANPYFWHKNDRTWHHSDVTHGRPFIGVKFSFG